MSELKALITVEMAIVNAGQNFIINVNGQAIKAVADICTRGKRKSGREILTAQWGDIDLDNRQWKVSGENGETDSVSLSSAAVHLIRQLPRWEDCPHVMANPRTKKPYRSIWFLLDDASRDSSR